MQNLKLSRIRRVADHLKILCNLPDTTPPFGLGGQDAPWSWCLPHPPEWLARPERPAVAEGRHAETPRVPAD